MSHNTRFGPSMEHQVCHALMAWCLSTAARPYPSSHRRCLFPRAPLPVFRYPSSPLLIPPSSITHPPSSLLVRQCSIARAPLPILPVVHSPVLHAHRCPSSHRRCSSPGPPLPIVVHPPVVVARSPLLNCPSSVAHPLIVVARSLRCPSSVAHPPCCSSPCPPLPVLRHYHILPTQPRRMANNTGRYR